MDTQQLIIRAISFGVLIPAIVFHEVAHGYVAYRLGDPTAKMRGRLSLNPLKHIDPFGTILLPLLMVAMLGFGFGYAKPVPVNPAYFKDRRQGMFLTGIAGPSANLVMAMIGGVGVRVLSLMPSTGLDTIIGFVWVAFYYFAYMNLALMFFNLIPLPPLDGSRILPLFLSDRAMHTYAKFEQYGFVILFGILFLSNYIGLSLFDAYFRYTVDPLLLLFTGVG